MDRAEKHKGMGGGYTMEAMVDAALAIERLELADLEPASEASMFSMRGEKSSLKIVADIVRRLLSEPDYAEAAIAHSVAQGAPPAGLRIAPPRAKEIAPPRDRRAL